MSAFQQALANVAAQPASGSGSSMPIRGQATGAPSARGLGSALKAAGIGKDSGMEVDGGRPQRGAARRQARNTGGPLDQTGRHRPNNNTPYAKPPGDRDGSSGRRRPDGPPPPLATRLHKAGKTNLNPNPRRQPVGTPPILKQARVENKAAQEASHAKLRKQLGSEDMKQWLRSRLIGEGIMDMSGLHNDPWLKEQGILPPGHVDAPPTAGTIFWHLIDDVIQKPNNTPVHTLSLAGNTLHSLHQLSKLPNCLPHLRALDISNNPIRRVQELDELLAQGEKKGKATAGVGGLKSLSELKLNGCLFREQMLSHAKGAETYQHEILRRFPGLLILDAVNLNRIVFGIPRQPKVKRTDEERAVLAKNPFTFPFDVQGGFVDNQGIQDFVMQFCAKYFPLFDNDRAQLIPAYADNATISISANTLISRSVMQKKVADTRHLRPNPVSFEAWTNLPGRNFLRQATSIDQRMRTLKSPMDQTELLRFWGKAVPKTNHPLDDASKWCIDLWVLDGQGTETKICAMIQGQFEEMPSGTHRSFSRSFILADAPQGSPAQTAGFPVTILSDTMIVHSYMSSAALDDNRSIAQCGVTIVPPLPAASTSTSSGQEALVSQLRGRTGMNAQFASMCLSQNGWDFEKALRNFEEIKSSIPPEAFQ